MGTDSDQYQNNMEQSYADAEVFVCTGDLGRTQYHHRPCGKRWLEFAGDESPNHCPGCGKELFADE